MATSNLSLPYFPPFDVHVDGNVGPRWKKWLARFERLLIGTNITEAKRKRALLLHYAGPAVDEIFDTLPNTGEDKDYKEAVDALNAYFLPQVNSTFEEYNFRQAKQQRGENIDAYNTRLRKLAQTCDFADVDKEVKSQIIIGCSSQRLRRKALRDNPTLKDLLAAGRAQERSEAQAEAVEKGVSPVNSIHHEQSQRDIGNTKNHDKNQQSKSRYFGNTGNQQTPPGNRSFPPRNRSFPPKNRQTPPRNQLSGQQCRNCGGIFPHNGDCPAKGKECRACGKSGHFSKVCRSKPKRREIHQVSETPSEEPQYLFTLQNNHQRNMSPRCEVYIANEAVQTIVDSGASVNVIDEPTYEKIRKRNPNAVLTTPRSKIFTYGSNMELPLLGMTTAEIRFHSTTINATFYVTKGQNGNLLSCNTAESLGILKITVNTTLHAPNTPPEQNFPDLFNGIGKIKGKTIKLHIDPEVEPKQQPHRRIPFHTRKNVKQELQSLDDLDIIETVGEARANLSPVAEEFVPCSVLPEALPEPPQPGTFTSPSNAPIEATSVRNQDKRLIEMFEETLSEKRQQFKVLQECMKDREENRSSMSSLTAAKTALDKEVQKLKFDLTQLKERNAMLSDDVEGLTERLMETEESNTRLKSQVVALTNKLREKENGQESNRSMVASLNSKLQENYVENDRMQKNWKQEMNVFLRQYRATPHSTTNTSPSEALNSRKMQTPLPQFTDVPDPKADNSIHETDREKKRQMKEYADKRRCSKTSEIKVGDTVLIQQPKANKLSTPFNPSPYKVIAKKGSMVTAERGSHKVTRNVSFFKKTKATFIPEDATDDESDDPIPHSLQHHQEQRDAPQPPRRSQRSRQSPNRLRY